MKQFLILFALMFISPLFASGIVAGETSASCDNTTLETYSGTANVEINWEPNTIQTRWYNGNTLIDTTNTNSDSCVYDDVLNVPPTPTNRTGYTFTGWTLRPEIDFGTINTSENSIERWARTTAYCSYATIDENSKFVACNSDNNFNELNIHEWKVKYNHGFLYGMSGCSSSGGAHAQQGTPEIGTGQYCWCKATGYRTLNGGIVNRSKYTLSWVFVYNCEQSSHCEQGCAIHCSNSADYSSYFRTALYTPAN